MKNIDVNGNHHINNWRLPPLPKLFWMKLSFILIAVFMVGLQLTMAEPGYGQELDKKVVHLKVTDEILPNIFKEIEKQTALHFAYNPEQVGAYKASINKEAISVSDALKMILTNTPLKFTSVKDKVIITKSTISSVPKLQTSQRSTYLRHIDYIKAFTLNISGKVTDHQGDPLIGVNILVEGTNKGTTTDFDGEFTLTDIDDQAVLLVSYIGYKSQEIPVEGRTEFSIVMVEDAQTLDEVVVVGYGTQKRANLTGAVGQVSADDIAARPDANIVSSLQGMIPGLNIQVNTGDPTKTPEINIRGFNSINGGSPLILIDGIEGDITKVNPQDIKNVTVLKDAASAAIYGARGSFGVILITTKQGEAGEMAVNYTNNFAWTRPTTRTDFISDPYAYGKMIDAAIYGYNGSSYTGYNDFDWETIKLVSKGEIEPFHEKQSDGSYKFFYNTDWYSYLFKEYQPSQNHNLSISGGNEKLRGYLSGRVYNRETIQNIRDADMDRYNLNANITFVPNSWLELSNNIKFTHELDEDFGGYRNGYGGIWSTTTFYDLFAFYPNKLDGQPVDVGRGGNGGQGGHAAMEDGNNWRKWLTDEFTNTFRAKLTPIKDLVVNFDYSTRINNTHRTYRYNEFEYLTTDRLSEETVGLNRLGEWRWKNNYNALNLFGTYAKSLQDKHNFKLLLGYNQETFSRDRIVAQSEDLLVRDKANLAFGTEMYNIDGSSLDWAVQGYFGRWNYDYEQKYLLEVNARYDGSSRFPKDTRWGFFPSVSAGWQVNREDFWRPLDHLITSMKLRASYGALGNQSVGVNTFQQLMQLGKSSWLNNGLKLNYAGAPSPLPKVVTWETTRSLDLGIDLAFLENKLFVSFDWFEKNTEDMYLPGKPLPGVFGSAEPRENFASLRNRGIELTTSYRNEFDLGGHPFSFRVSAMLSNFKGVITKYDNPEGLMSTYWEGQELGEIWGYKVAGQFKSDEEAAAYQAQFENPSNSLGKVYKYIINTVQNSEWNKLRAGDIEYVDANGDGRIDRGEYRLDNHGDIQPIGNAMPKFPFGFNMSGSWRNIDVALAGAGVGKQNWYPTGDRYWGPYLRPYITFVRKDLIDNAWSPDNPNNKYPQVERGYAALGSNRSLYEMNDYYLENIGYLRVKNLTLGYTLPRHLTNRIDVKKVRIYFSGENILTWRFGNLTKYIDPEQAGSAISYSNPGDAVARADLRDYPMGKTYSFGINIKL